MSSDKRQIMQATVTQPGIFSAGDHGGLWRVIDGVVRLDRDGGAVRLPVQLALPGDLIGVEALCDQPYQLNAAAFTDCRVERVEVGSEPQRQVLLQQALLQQQNRCQDMATLRTGSVAQRLGHLLALLGLPWQGQVDNRATVEAMRRALPSLQELSEVVDAKRETVCRTLGLLLPSRRRQTAPAQMPPVSVVARLYPSDGMRLAA